MPRKVSVAVFELIVRPVLNSLRLDVIEGGIKPISRIERGVTQGQKTI